MRVCLLDNKDMNIAIIVFAGKGTRINSSIPKQFIKIKEKELVYYTIKEFEEHPLIDQIVLVTSSEYISYVENMIHTYAFQKIIKVVEGGATRQESVRNALNIKSLTDGDNILIHDGDRPLVSNQLISRCIRELDSNDSAVPFIEICDRYPETSHSGRSVTLDGKEVDIQTPQCFKLEKIRMLHNRLKDMAVSDDASIFELGNEKVNYFKGESLNFKVTTDLDLTTIKAIIMAQ